MPGTWLDSRNAVENGTHVALVLWAQEKTALYALP